MFSREGGSPVWIPAFEGKHAVFVSLGEGWIEYHRPP